MLFRSHLADEDHGDKHLADEDHGDRHLADGDHGDDHPDDGLLLPPSITSDLENDLDNGHNDNPDEDHHSEIEGEYGVEGKAIITARETRLNSSQRSRHLIPMNYDTLTEEKREMRRRLDELGTRKLSFGKHRSYELQRVVEDWKSTRLNSSHSQQSRMPSSA